MLARWQNQEEGLAFVLAHHATMLDFDMGTGKTRVAIDAVFAMSDVKTVLVLCPKAVVPVWRQNIKKFYPEGGWSVWDTQKGSVKSKAADLKEWLSWGPDLKRFVVINYDSAWRDELGDIIMKHSWGMVILDESHRVKAANSKISRFVARLGRRVPRKLCLSGTPMAHSPLDIYGQYRFLDPAIFGTNWSNFLSDFAIMGGPERRFIVGYKNQQELYKRFKTIAISCRMSDVRERLKLPETLPDTIREVTLSPADMRTLRDLEKDFIAATQAGTVVVKNVLVKLLRCQQITSGFCVTQEDPLAAEEVSELNNTKEKELCEILEDIGPYPVVVFCNFRHDLDAIGRVATKLRRTSYELSGRVNQLAEWQEKGKELGAILVVQIQAGAEGVDMTQACHAIYYSLPYSLALYNQSRARLYRPGQKRPVSFIHMLAKNTIDEGIYAALERKEEIIDQIKAGTFDFGYAKK